MNMPDILEKINAHKQREVESEKNQLGLPNLIKQLEHVPMPRDFVGAMRAKIEKNIPAVIAEIKKASPSKGIIREDFDPVAIAKSYENHGASCLSILTDEKFFQGNKNYISKVKNEVNLPILRKDFIIDAYQIYQSKLIGADCILLIVASLMDRQLKEFYSLAHNLGLAVLVEIHDEHELKRALKLELSMIGINNRNLRNFETDIHTTINLLSMIPDNILVVTESGIHNKEDVALMLHHHVYGFLIGESFMRAKEPGEKLAHLFRKLL